MALSIKAENISKAYQLGEIGTGTLSRDIERWFAKVRGKEDPFLKIGESNDRTVKSKTDVVWSLKDINFGIKEGDAVGIIGRNGAGKSTLLKVLSRVTAPTTGSVKVKGRIASLLEVGTGFHPELTGRENIYLNGAILGMRKKEISRKFDDIVDFAGVERYIDTPVKRYSSGMYVRLAFAVAAHLDSEILIVDEVLAVGDAEFQRKCLGKMGEVSKSQGRTVLFVSHNLGAVQSLCTSAIILSKGQLDAYSEDVSRAISIYSNTVTQNEWTHEEGSAYERIFQPLNFYLSNTNQEKNNCYSRFDDIQINILFEIGELDPRLEIGIRITTSDQIVVLHSQFTDDTERKWPEINLGQNHLKVLVPKHLLNNGVYNIELYASLYKTKWLYEPGINSPSIKLVIEGKLSESAFWLSARPGAIAPTLSWTK